MWSIYDMMEETVKNVSAAIQKRTSFANWATQLLRHKSR